MVTDHALECGSQALDAATSGKPPPVKRTASVLALKPRELAFDMADDLSAVDAPDELVEGLLTRGAMSVVYGDSNSGKTFLSIDIGCAVARGEDWLGRRVEPGLVVYLAAESPQSVRTRLLAYQREHAVEIRLLAIVKTPIDLFSTDADATAVIELVKILEGTYRTPVQLIIGDTLARLAAGANENSGEDMSIVVRNIDRIREQCDAHFLLIHHSGKDATRGMRGWSGLRAATDTEIEVTSDQEAGTHAAEVTKQRDIGGKGDRIGFTLRVVELGIGKWSKPITSCIVVGSDAPPKRTQKRRASETDGAILELLTSQSGGMKKGDVVKHFDGRYQKGPIYRAMKALVEEGKLNESVGIVAIRRQP